METHACNTAQKYRCIRHRPFLAHARHLPSSKCVVAWDCFNFCNMWQLGPASFLACVTAEAILGQQPLPLKAGGSGLLLFLQCGSSCLTSFPAVCQKWHWPASCLAEGGSIGLLCLLHYLHVAGGSGPLYLIKEIEYHVVRQVVVEGKEALFKHQ
eukprot:1147180-Pelagomonas_calceolata.AAC.2